MGVELKDSQLRLRRLVKPRSQNQAGLLPSAQVPSVPEGAEKIGDIVKT